jgi:hypothetical protein
MLVLLSCAVYIIFDADDVLLGLPSEQQVLMVLILNEVATYLLKNDLVVKLIVKVHHDVHLRLFDQ